jgi:hypothetical protein
MTPYAGSRTNNGQASGCPPARRTESLGVWPSDSDSETSLWIAAVSPSTTHTEPVGRSCMMERYLQPNADVHVHERLWAESPSYNNGGSSKGKARRHQYRPRTACTSRVPEWGLTRKQIGHRFSRAASNKPPPHLRSWRSSAEFQQLRAHAFRVILIGLGSNGAHPLESQRQEKPL